MITAASHVTADEVVNWIFEFWWIGLLASFFLGGLFEGIRDFFIDTVTDIMKVRHKQRMVELKAQAKAATIAAPLPVVPGPCQHRHVTPVIGVDDIVVAWLCKNEECSQQLPANWAVRQEDLE